MADSLDTGDKLACGLGFKKNIGNYSSFDWHASITITKREGESDEEFSLRGWAAAQKELIQQVESSDELLEVVRPVVGSHSDYD
jgi:hypothetical protein